MTVARPGDKLAIGGVEIVVTGGVHACLHPDLPESDNNPRIAIPIHQAGLVPAHQGFHHQLLTALAPAGARRLAPVAAQCLSVPVCGG
ncbi:hypothetical protein GKO32_11285 [Amycolatopsis sp. RM579]|uniref:Uncharacterized protein n=1 Tax=Amycolatopsis pithecellobii TaxID=664692 RepID=A0A6N7Z580_9PSEU|nr:hypothetical protein [Amycolatopsis pithecellobii]